MPYLMEFMKNNAHLAEDVFFSLPGATEVSEVIWVPPW